MALEPQPSRFAVLPDDVPEPTGKKSSSGDSSKTRKKKQAKQNGEAKGDKKGTASKAASANKKGKSLKSLAFGGAKEGKKKGNGQPQNQNTPPVVGVDAGGSGDGPHRKVNKESVQWEEWRRRDSENVDETFESELEQALVQSQLDYQSEVARKDGSGKGAKSKKKGITVPLNEFNTLHLEAVNSVKPTVDPSEDEGLIEKFRTEARLQIEREKELQTQREILATRQESVYKHPNSKERNKEQTKTEVDGNSIIVENLRAENELLKSELESYKSRLKKVHDIFQNAQELKDKAKLIFQVETLTKVQEDLQEQLQNLHSQLEQERSRSHEYRKLLETRKRTQTESST